MDKIKNFLAECKSELKKIVWPEKNELMNTTWVVISAVVILTTLVYCMDFIYLYVINRMLN